MLTEVALRAAKPREKAYKLFDGKGLYLLVSPNGSRGWRVKYRFAGREKLLSLGTYPEVSLKEARARLDTERRLLRDRVDPAEKRRADRFAALAAADNTLAALTAEWIAKNRAEWSETYTAKIQWLLDDLVLPWLGKRPVKDLLAPEILSVLRRIEERGAIETAHRAQQTLSRVLRYGVATLRCERDCAADLRGALATKKVVHHASITEPTQIGELLRAIDAFEGSFVVRQALRLLPLVFVRPGELRGARWAEMDLDAERPEWRIPAERMKMGVLHIVPLSSQAVAVLKEIQPLSGAGELVFPGERSRLRPLSENTLNAALRRLGYTKEQMTAHGFRSMASTLLNEQGWHRDAIERQLAHGERDTVRAAYNRALHLPERRKMMQAWGDYLDNLKARGQAG
ncbi:MAG: tyrosine-type recombinase/integrase [Steroidobacteraceae bacterium]